MLINMWVLLVVALTSHALGEKLKSLDEAIEILGELAGENLLIDPRDQENEVTEEAEETDDTLQKREHEDANTLAPHRAQAAIGRDAEKPSREHPVGETASLDNKLSAYNAFARKTHQASVDSKLSAYNAFARKTHQGVDGGKGTPDSDNWVFVEVPVGEDGDVIGDDTQSNRLAAYNALRRGDNRLAAYDGLRRGDNRLAAYDGLRKGDNRLAAYDGLRNRGSKLAAYDALRQGVGKAAAHDALVKGDNKVAAHDALNKIAPHDALNKVAPHDALNKIAPNDALNKVAPHDALNKVAPHDALNRVAPHDHQKRKSEEGNDVIKTKIVAFKV